MHFKLNYLKLSKDYSGFYFLESLKNIVTEHNNKNLKDCNFIRINIKKKVCPSVNVQYLFLMSLSALKIYPLFFMMPRHLMITEYLKAHCGIQPKLSFSVVHDFIASCRTSAGMNSEIKK